MVMRQYTGTRLEDLALATWWTLLHETGDLDRLMLPRDRPLGAFLGRLRPPTRLWYSEDTAGLWVALWGMPWCDGAVLGLWVRQDHRRTKGALRAVEAAVAHALTVWPVLIVLARQPRLRRLYARVGVQWAPVPVPGLIDGEPTLVGWLTAATFHVPARVVMEAVA